LYTPNGSSSEVHPGDIVNSDKMPATILSLSLLHADERYTRLRILLPETGTRQKLLQVSTQETVVVVVVVVVLQSINQSINQ